MATMTFQINDASTDSTIPAVWVTIGENADGTLAFNITQQGGVVGDLRGIFFDVADESILKSLVVTATSSDIRIGDDSIKDLGDGANMLGLLGSDKGYDVAIEIGSAGIGKDDIRSYSFTLDSTLRDLTLADFAYIDFAARLTSVGIIGGVRADSSKLLELTSQAVDARNDLVSLGENAAAASSVLANDATAGGTKLVTGWSGGSLGSTVALESDGDIIGTLALNADGTYALDTGAADELSAGEHIIFDFSYGVRNQTESTSWSDDTGNLVVVITGANDGPEARDDSATTTENAASVTGSVTGNDSDVDRLDTISVRNWSGGSLGATSAISNGAGATVTLNTDGSYVLNAASANALSAGETITQQYQYTLADNHGAIDTATFSVTVTGTNDGPDARDDSARTAENAAPVSGSVTGNDSDVDRLDTISVRNWSGGSLGATSAISNGAGATVTLNTDGSYVLNAANANALSAGETITQQFQYTLADNHGATDTATFSVTVTGTNDGPEARDDNATTTENAASVTGSVTGNDSDVDRLDTISIRSWSGGSLGATSAISNGAGATVTLNSNGSYVLNAANANALSAGETITQQYQYTLADNYGATDTATFSVTVTGTNDGPDARDDSAATTENAASVTGSVIGNDSDVDRLDTISIRSWSGGSLGATSAVSNGAGATVTLNTDGSYVLNAASANALSVGETITQQFQYTLADNHGATDNATFSVTVTGTNDGPDARDDDAGAIAENQFLSGSVATNDSDVDRLDTHTWSLIEGSFNGQGDLIFNENGTWTYDPRGAYNDLTDGQSVELSFRYVVTDNHGATDVATMTFQVTGSGSVVPPTPPTTSGGNDFPTWGQDISHFTLVFNQTVGDDKPRTEGDGYYTVKIDVDGSFNDDMDVSIASILSMLDAKDGNVTADSELLGLVIKGGLQTTQYFDYGNHNLNGESPDDLPDGIGFDLVGNLTEQPTNAIDAAYSYGWLIA